MVCEKHGVPEVNSESGWLCETCEAEARWWWEKNRENGMLQCLIVPGGMGG